MQKKYFLKQDKSRLILSSLFFSFFFSLFHSFSSFLSFWVSSNVFLLSSHLLLKYFLLLKENPVRRFFLSFSFFFSLSLIFQPIYFFKDFFFLFLLLISFISSSHFCESNKFSWLMTYLQTFPWNTKWMIGERKKNWKRKRKYQRMMEKEQLFHPSKKASFFSLWYNIFSIKKKFSPYKIIPAAKLFWIMLLNLLLLLFILIHSLLLFAFPPDHSFHQKERNVRKKNDGKIDCKWSCLLRESSSSVTLSLSVSFAFFSFKNLEVKSLSRIHYLSFIKQLVTHFSLLCHFSGFPKKE